MQGSVVAIGLDATNPDLLDRWMTRGLLPNLADLRKRGCFGKLTSAITHHRAETPWTVFLTGCLPNKTGYWSPIDYEPSHYRCADPELDEGGYDFAEYRPFYSTLGDNFPIAVLDMPQTVLCEGLTGIQVLGWGAHARMTPRKSDPPDLYRAIVEKYGPNPLLDCDSITQSDPQDEPRFLAGLEPAITRKAEIVIDLLRQRRWSLLLTTFGEAHSVHHYLWHRSQPHPVNGGHPEINDNPMLRAFQMMDAAIGRISAAAPDDATIVVFAVHGTGANNGDLGANVFLPEMLYRWNLPGRYALGPGMADSLPLAAPRVADQSAWWNEVWHQRYEPKRFKSLLRRYLPMRLYHSLHLERLTGAQSATPLAYMPDLYWLPASWYRDLWPTMRAFALPSYSDGLIRINLSGRDPHGLVRRDDYERTCDEIVGMLMKIRNRRSGERVIREVIRIPRGEMSDGQKLPAADLIAMFEDFDYPADCVCHPSLGQIGPMPFGRTGGHYSTGFFLAGGPGIPAGSTVAGDVLDIAPTLLAMMQAPVPDYMDGKLLRISPAIVG